MTTSDHTYAVILAGGGGTRLWPKSRNRTPKQFLKLTGADSMMQVAAKRMLQLVDWDHIIVVTNQAYIAEVKAQLPQVPDLNIIAEPAKKDTALAMLVGALYARTLDPEAVVLNGASDHVVVNEAEFARVMKAALEVAAQRLYLLAVGISPTHPTSAFGYIKIGEELGKVGNRLSFFKVASFTEKPNIATARAFISTGKYFWNANMYVWACDSLIAAFQEHQKTTYELIQPLLNISHTAFQKALHSIYEQAEAISIDYAISEKVSNLALIPGDFGWNDVGDWRVVYELGQADANGNVIISDTKQKDILAVNSQDNMIQVSDRLIALYGIKDMIVVDTPEILMIVPKLHSQEVKKLVEKLKAEHQEKYL